MNILAVCQYYTPEPFSFHDVCEELVRRGHRVTVLTGVPNYPMGKIYPGYEHKQRRTETLEGVSVLRCATHPRGTGSFDRLLNYFSYAVFASRKASRLPGDFDVVLINQLSPIMMAWPGLRYAKKHGCRTVLYCMDLWPASLKAGGLGERSLIYRLFGRISARVYRRVDLLINSSRQFADYEQSRFQITPEKLFWLPQYAESLYDPAQCRKKPNETVDLMFAGNVGKAQSLDTVIAAAKLAKNPRLRWHIVGDGSDLARLRNLAAGMENVVFHGRLPASEMPACYAMADAMLVTLTRDPVISLTLPGKVQACMAAGKPLLCAADGETARTVAEADCGVCVPAEDAAALAAAADAFAERTDKDRLGQNALAYSKAHFSRTGFMEALEGLLAAHVKGREEA